VSTIDGIDDGADFRVVRDAMTAVKISPELQSKMFCIVSAVLWLGNVSFVATSDDATRVEKDGAFGNACALLELAPEVLEFALTHRMVSAGGESYEVPLNLGNALDTRDALAKARTHVFILPAA
jgi:myosin V